MTLNDDDMMKRENIDDGKKQTNIKIYVKKIELFV